MGERETSGPRDTGGGYADFDVADKEKEVIWRRTLKGGKSTKKNQRGK